MEIGDHPETQSQENSALVQAYEKLVFTGELSKDSRQAEAVALLDTIVHAIEVRGSRAFSFIDLFKQKPAPRGAYIWGDVGRGKTLLMDLFYANVGITRKRRVHFHAFMDEVHAGIAAFRAQPSDSKTRRDPIPFVTKPLIDSVDLLCLDEFHVLDITNAMLLQRLFEHLFAAGIVVVSTSNVEPDRLYENGLNRQLFLPFIDMLKQQCTIFNLAAATDYRLEKLSGEQVYYFGSGKGARDAVDSLWLQITGVAHGEPSTVHSLGRDIVVPQEADGVARFECADLCENPLGARDYLRLADAYHTFVIDDIPAFDRTKSSAAKRFILLIDTLYDRGIKLFASFNVPLKALGADKTTAVEFERCVSRLIEMQSDEYLLADKNAPKPR